MYASPIWKFGENEIAFAGEVGKWAMVSPTRFSNIDITEDLFRVFMKGVPGEDVILRFIISNNGTTTINVLDETCVISKSGRSSIVVSMSDKEPALVCQDA